jgi:hypothetical protein
MAMKAKAILTLIIGLLTLACEEAIDLPLRSENLNLLVVEGILTNEKLNHKITLSHPYINQNGNPAPASGAVVSVTDGVNNIFLTEFPIGSGEYYTPPIRAVFGKIYTLTIQYQGKDYFAQDSPAPGEPLQPLVSIFLKQDRMHPLPAMT